MMNHGESPAEFFDYKCHPFADTYRLKTPYLGAQDQRFFKTALSLISTGKSLALCGPSGAGKSTLVHYVLSKLDANCYKPAVVHYGGLQRNGILKALADVLGVETSGRTVPLLIKLQKQIMKMASDMCLAKVVSSPLMVLINGNTLSLTKSNITCGSKFLNLFQR